jgi:hypothetical protein
MWVQDSNCHLARIGDIRLSKTALLNRKQSKPRSAVRTDANTMQIIADFPESAGFWTVSEIDDLRFGICMLASCASRASPGHKTDVCEMH